MPPAKPLERADNHLDVACLPQRQVGAWEDRWLRMNVHVPVGSGPFPCIVFVHGGGYGGGDEDGTLYGAGPPPRELLQRAVDEGYVAVNLNYILGRGTKPQVFWDYKTAIRFPFTTDGSEPGPTSHVSEKPLVLTGTTTIRAITVCQGERPSGVAAFTFSREDPPPEILAPEGPLLPRARVGIPYEVRFRASGGAALLWNLAGHLELGKEPNKGPSDPTGLRLNPATGVLSGTPTSPGVFSFQVQAAAGPGRPADARVYVLVIEP